MDSSHPAKRQKIRDVDFSTSRSISPPARRKKPAPSPASSTIPASKAVALPNTETPVVIPSPIKLTHIRDLPDTYNVDAIKLKDILGNPMIKECWQFNYLFDTDWLLSQFDEDVRSIVQLRIVHGSWKTNDPNKALINDACRRHENIKVFTAYIPDPFGTHHSKMMILFRHDDLAQVIIHTANMIPQDWTNMTQAAWISPLLPLLPQSSLEPSAPVSPPTSASPLGTGARFKSDLLSYLSVSNYGSSKTGSLVKELRRYDFTSVRAAFVASVPSAQNIASVGPSNESMQWGWPRLRQVLSRIPTSQGHSTNSTSGKPQIVLQASSIASLGTTTKYLDETIFPALSATSTPATAKPVPHIIFPTSPSIRRSLDGYVSGSSIHTNITNATGQKQLSYLRPYLRHWEVAPSERTLAQRDGLREAGRRNAAPHIKTYIRFTDEKMREMDWALMTSANLSTQAWGGNANKDGIVKVSSFETGVLIWPDLFDDDDGQGQAKMVPVFGIDNPARGERVVVVSTAENNILALDGGVNNDPATDRGDVAVGRGSSGLESRTKEDGHRVKVGFRMPYDLPLVPYGAEEEPWCARKAHWEPDWMGRAWGGVEG